MYAFSNERYLAEQLDSFQQKISLASGPTYIEFGGKPFGDYHAARVLPGYDPDVKAKLLRELNHFSKIVMVVSAQDVFLPPDGRTLQGRIRGDSGLFYDEETIRIILRARKFGFDIQTTVLSVTPEKLSLENRTKIEDFRSKLSKLGINLVIHYQIENYPCVSVLNHGSCPFEKNAVLSNAGQNITVFSPGGGSGKFGVLLSEIYHSLQRSENPHFVKFETFPVFRLPENHPLNIAFEAATADLGNKVITVEGGVNYDKDVENFALLVELFQLYCGFDHPVKRMSGPLDMGVNVIDQGIVKPELVYRACVDEVTQRLTRYQKEYAEGTEKRSTVDTTKKLLAKIIALKQEYGVGGTDGKTNVYHSSWGRRNGQNHNSRSAL